MYLGRALELKVTGKVNHCLKCFCAHCLLALRRLVCSCSKAAAQQFPAHLCGQVICSRNWVITSHCCGDFFTFFSGAAPFRAGLFKHNFSSPFKQNLDCATAYVWSALKRERESFTEQPHFSEGLQSRDLFLQGRRPRVEWRSRGRHLMVSALSLPCFWGAVELVSGHTFHGQSWWLWRECYPVSEPGGEGLAWKHLKQQGQHCPAVDYQLQCGSPVNALTLLKTMLVLALASTCQNVSPPFLTFNHSCVLLWWVLLAYALHSLPWSKADVKGIFSSFERKSRFSFCFLFSSFQKCLWRFQPCLNPNSPAIGATSALPPGMSARWVSVPWGRSICIHGSPRATERMLCISLVKVKSSDTLPSLKWLQWG